MSSPRTFHLDLDVRKFYGLRSPDTDSATTCETYKESRPSQRLKTASGTRKSDKDPLKQTSWGVGVVTSGCIRHRSSKSSN